MNFKIDHDLHIHSKLSLCSNDSKQTAENILKYGEKNNFKKICLTDHFWDDAVPCPNDWYALQNNEHIKTALPLPKSDTVQFCFGAEAELDDKMVLGISRETIDKLDFVIIPTTHLHMFPYSGDRAKIYTDRLDKLMDMDLPFSKIGIAHLTSSLIAPNYSTDFDEHIRILDSIDDDTFKRLFSKIATKGAGFELNFSIEKYSEKQLPRILRPYKLAKEVGCKFYLGSDAHHPAELDNAPSGFQMIVEKLDLKEEDKFTF